MSLFVPSCLLESVAEFGEEGARWLESLPERVSRLEREWGLRVGRAFDTGGCVSWVAPAALREGGEAVLKIGIPHEEARCEADALRLLDGDGAVRLLRVSEDGYTLLLERCVPGTDLWPLSEEEASAVGAAVLRRLWREVGPDAPISSLADVVEGWRRDLPRIVAAGGYDPELARRALDLGRELAASAPRRVLLHGDFHPGNVLAAQREPWLVIDPKPVVGDPAYDLAQWLKNSYEAAVLAEDPVAVLRDRVDRFARLLDLDPARIAGWTFVKSIGWEWGQEAAVIFEELARSCAPSAAGGAAVGPGRSGRA